MTGHLVWFLDHDWPWAAAWVALAWVCFLGGRLLPSRRVLDDAWIDGWHSGWDRAREAANQGYDALQDAVCSDCGWLVYPGIDHYCMRDVAAPAEEAGGVGLPPPAPHEEDDYGRGVRVPACESRPAPGADLTGAVSSTHERETQGGGLAAPLAEEWDAESLAELNDAPTSLDEPQPASPPAGVVEHTAFDDELRALVREAQAAQDAEVSEYLESLRALVREVVRP